MNRVFLLLPFFLVAHTPAAELTVRTDFPGGSAKVEQVDQTERKILFAPGGHADRGWVAWWQFKVEGIEPGEELTIELIGSGFAAPDRATFSTDNKLWVQTAAAERQSGRSVFRQIVNAREAWFAWGPPFQLSAAEELLVSAVRSSPHISRFELTKSQAGRSVPALKISFPGVPETQRRSIWVQARQHAWESGSSWVCRGFIEWLISDDPRADALRKQADVLIVPIMDVDNVETGNGGKNQKPHDHNRDWSDDPVWPEVRAAMSRIKSLNETGRFDLFVDLHNPGPGDKQPFFFASPDELASGATRESINLFLAAERLEITGPMKLGKDQNAGPGYDKNWEKISKNWVTKNCASHVVAVTLETSWNTPYSTTDGYLTVGRQLGLGMQRYIESRGKLP